MNSAFDPTSYLDATISEPSVRRPPLPAGRELVGIVQEVKPRSWQAKEDPTRGGIAVDIPVKIDLSAYPDLQQIIGATEVTLTDGLILDLTPNGAIDNSPGKNNKLRRWREALDMNKPGDTFSFRLMQGRMVKVKIGHRIDNRVSPPETYDQIDGVVKA